MLCSICDLLTSTNTVLNNNRHCKGSQKIVKSLYKHKGEEIYILCLSTHKIKEKLDPQSSRAPKKGKINSERNHKKGTAEKARALPALWEKHSERQSRQRAQEAAALR